MRYEIDRASGGTPPVEQAVRDGDEWFIEINTMEELRALIEEVGYIVVGRNDITIYDDYME